MIGNFCLILLILIGWNSCSNIQEEKNKRQFCSESNSILKNLGSPNVLIVVTTSNGSSYEGELSMWKKTWGGRWLRDKNIIDVMIGRNGIGIGHEWKRWNKYFPYPLKKEGDGKTPMGIYRIGTKFGFKEQSEYGQTDNYLKIKGDTVCVDDPNSTYYNKILVSSEKEIKNKNWNSAEVMSREPLYNQGILIEYVSSREERAGSCIFIHEIDVKKEGTSGCIAMKKENIEFLYNELKDNTNAAIITMTKNDFEKHKECLLN